MKKITFLGLSLLFVLSVAAQEKKVAAQEKKVETEQAEIEKIATENKSNSHEKK